MAKTWIRIISILEIIGGLSGIAFVVWQISARSVDGQKAVLAAIAIAIYLLGLIAGIALWRATAFGRIASIIVQAIQLPKYISQLLIFMFSFGFDTYIYGMLTNNAQPIFGFEFKFLAFNQLFVNVPDAPAGIGIGIPACLFIVMLLRFKPQRALSDDPSRRPEQALAADSVESGG